MTKTAVPKWHRELDIFRKIKPVIIMEGNVLDMFTYPGAGINRLRKYLHYYFRSLGYPNIIFYDSIRGFFNDTDAVSGEYVQKFADLIGEKGDPNALPFPFIPQRAGDRSCAFAIERAMTQEKAPCAAILDLASHYTGEPGPAMQQQEIDAYTRLLRASLDSREPMIDRENDKRRLKNLTVYLVNKVNDIPAWFYLDNPSVSTIHVGTPTKEERRAYVSGVNFEEFFSPDKYREGMELYRDREADLDKLRDRFTGLTEGFTNTELYGLGDLCRNEGLEMKDLCKVIDLYKFGISENKWEAIDYRDWADAKADFEKRVKGQDYALSKTLDVIKRAVTGLTDIQSSSHGKPKGVLFFAGPTGTGKTETAKTLAEKLFGDESACIRFDMSEYGQPHSDQKLLGAPPGYVGYEAGGQLTNAVKNNPFSILLFDEIEKAHPSILDKFLQILEDGRMTDGQGNTVYFSETVIIFTSNLGIYAVNETGHREQVVFPEMDYEEVRQQVREGIETYFKLQLGRPEILNRIGENIVVFDFIREEAATRILDAKLRKIADNLREDKDIELTVSEEAYEALRRNALANLENGGRGIGNIVESMFVNPLARYMFDAQVFRNARIEVLRIDEEDPLRTMTCSVTPLTEKETEEEAQ
ncbi:MAG: ATP-dependent Clp protease ATP-binding subunit [Abditibacteriota bacterium]|nr:ATP-dependent Clp protease ATP-binding subunit [Abditibacteriota bacterium]